jgi:Ala-tRNA(Pro) deacylase
MSLSPTLRQFLADNGIDYEVLAHERALTSARAAQASHVPGDFLAKGVILKDEDRYLLAVLPASHHLRMGELARKIGRPLGLATEGEVAAIFKDCDLGAVPPVGRAYGLETVVDESLVTRSDVFFEGGDHESLVHVDGSQFGRLIEGARQERFSRHDGG